MSDGVEDLKKTVPGKLHSKLTEMSKKKPPAKPKKAVPKQKSIFDKAKSWFKKTPPKK